MKDNGVKYPETVEDVMLDPHRYGLPTLEEYKRNPSAYKMGSEYLLGTVDRGSKVFTKGFKRYTFEIAGYKARSLEEVQTIAANEGLDWQSMDILPIVIPGTFGESRVHVRFEQRKAQDEKRKVRR